MGIGFDVTNKLIHNASSSMMDAASVINSVAANIAAPRGGSSCAFSSHSEREAFMNYCQAQGAQVNSVKFGNDYVVSFGGDSARAEQLMNSFRNEHGGGSMHSFDSSQYKTNAQYSSITHTLVSGALSSARGYAPGVNESLGAINTIKSVSSSVGMMATASPNIIRAAASRACSDIASYRVKGGLSQSNAHYDAVHVIGGQVFLRGKDVTNTELGTRALQMHAQRNNDARAITGSDHDLARGVTRDVMHDAEVSGREEREAIERQARQIVDSNYGYNESAYIIADSMALKDAYSSYSATGDTYLSSLQDIQSAMQMNSADINAGNLSGDSLDYLRQNDADLYNSLSGGGTVSLTFEERMNAQKVVNSFESSMFTMSSEQQNMVNNIMDGKGLNALNGLDQENLNAMLRRMQGNNLDAAQSAAISSLLNKQGNVAAEMAALNRINVSLGATTSASEIAALNAQRASLEASLRKYEADLRTAMMAADDINRRNTTTLNNLKENLGLTGAEQHVARNAELLKDLERDYGIDLTGRNAEAELNRFKQETYRKFYEADVNILKLNGSIDRDRLYSLSEAELARIGLTARERDLFASLQFGRLVDIQKLQQALQRLAIRLQGAKNLAMTLVNQGIGQGEQEFLKATRYSMQAVKTARALAAASLKYQMATLRTVRVVGSRFIPGSIRNSLPHIRMPLRNSAGAVRTSLAMARQSVNQAIHYNPVARTNRRVRAFFKGIKDNAVGWAANSRVGRILHNIGAAVSAPFKWAKKLGDFVKKAIGAVAGFLLGAASFLVAFVCVYMLIGSLADAINGARLAIYNALAPADYADTVAYQLYDNLKDDEDTWINHLGNTQLAFVNKADILYGEDYQKFEDYIAVHPELSFASDGTLCVNPFFTKNGFETAMVWQEEDENSTKGDFIEADAGSGTWNKDGNFEQVYLTKTDAFDGINSMNIGTNDSIYTETEGKTYGGYIANIETGHTSNIKDIIAMTDIMYQHEMDAFFDSCGEPGSGSEGILGASPAQLTYQNASTKMHGLFGWVWKGLFGGEDTTGGMDDASVWERLNAAHKEYEGSTVSYNTVTSYAENLFNMTHQEQWFLDVDFFDCDFTTDGTRIITDPSDDDIPLVNPLTIGKDNAITILPEQQGQASQLHACLNPVVNPFYIKYVTSPEMLATEKGTHVYGSARAADGTATGSTYFLTDTDLFPVNIGMSNILEDKVYDSYLDDKTKANRVIQGIRNQLKNHTISWEQVLTDDTDDWIVDGFVNRINWKPESYFYSGHTFNPATLGDPNAERVQNLRCLDDSWEDNKWAAYDPNTIPQYTHISSGYCKCWELASPAVPGDKKYKGKISDISYIEEGAINDRLEKNEGKSIFNWGQIVTKSLPDAAGNPNKEWDPNSNYSGSASYGYYVASYTVLGDDGLPRIATPEEVDMILRGKLTPLSVNYIKDDPNEKWGSVESKCGFGSHGGNPEKQHHNKEEDVASVDIDARDYFKEENLATIDVDTEEYYDSPEDAKAAIGIQLAAMLNDGTIEEKIRDAIKADDPKGLDVSEQEGKWYHSADDITDGVGWHCEFNEDRTKFTVTYYETLYTMLNRMKWDKYDTSDKWRTKQGSRYTEFLDQSEISADVRRPMLYQRMDLTIPADLSPSGSDLHYALGSNVSTTSGSGIIAFYDYDTKVWKTNLMKYADSDGNQRIKVWACSNTRNTTPSASTPTMVEDKLFFPYVYKDMNETAYRASGSGKIIHNYEEFRYALSPITGEPVIGTNKYNYNALISLSELKSLVGETNVVLEGEGAFATYDIVDSATHVTTSYPRSTKVTLRNPIGPDEEITVSVECVKNDYAESYAKVKVNGSYVFKEVYHYTSGLHSNVFGSDGMIKDPATGEVEYNGNVALSTTKTYEYIGPTLLKSNGDGTYENRRNELDLINKDIPINEVSATEGAIVLRFNILATNPREQWCVQYYKTDFEKYNVPEYEDLVDKLLELQGRDTSGTTYDGWDVKEENWINLRCYDPDSNTDYDFAKVPAEFVSGTDAHQYDSRAYGPLYGNCTIEDIKDKWYSWDHHTHHDASTYEEKDDDGNVIATHPIDAYCEQGPSTEHEDVRYTRIDTDHSEELGCRYGAVWNQIVLCKKRTIVYERKCLGHLFAYCGGHIGAHAHGIVYSATNEQMTIAGVKEEEKIAKPLFDSSGNIFDVDKYMGSEIIGKIDEETLDYTSFGSFVSTGQCAQGPEEKQGSIWSTQSRGPNLLGSSSGWGTTLGGMSTYRLELNRGSLKDIFDVDMGISYGYNMFPLFGEWENYEGWTSGNMSMCMGKITADWGELYGFDIPLEIGDHIAKGTEKYYETAGALTTSTGHEYSKQPVVTPDENGLFGAFSAADNFKASRRGHTSYSDPNNITAPNVRTFCQNFINKLNNLVSDATTAVTTPGSVYIGNKSYYGYHLFNTGLTQQDIEAIDIGLSEAYPGYANDTERQEHVHRVLGLVGNANAENYMGKDMYRGAAGSYSRHDLSHNDIGFLTYAENPTGSGYAKDYASTIGSEFSLIHYLINAANPGVVIANPAIDDVTHGLDRLRSGSFYNEMTGKITAQPGDYIYTTTGLNGVRKYGPKAAERYDLDGLNNLPIYGATVDDDTENSIKYDLETLKYYASPYHAAVFIGVFNKDIRLSSGQEIQKGVPVYVDMTTLSKYINYSRALEISQDIPTDIIYSAYKTISGNEDGIVNDADMDIMRMKSAYGIMEYTNGARSIGGVYLHGANSTDYWFRKNRADAYWVWKYVYDDTKHDWVGKPGVSNVWVINYKG